MRIADPYVDELTSEASTTKRVLERVPEAHLNWRPHEKSMSLGQLALHVATLPRQLTEFVTGDALDFGAAAGAPPTVSSHQELLAAFASSIEQAQSYLATLSDERASATWRLMAGITGITIADSCSSTCDCSMYRCHRSTDPPLMKIRLRMRNVMPVRSRPPDEE